MNNTPLVVTKPIDADYELDDFRSKRLHIVSSDDCPVALQDGGQLLLHLLPVTAFDRTTIIDLTTDERTLFPLFGISEMNRRFNVDGKISYSNGTEGVRSYVQLFHNGMIESVYVFAERNGQRRINLPRLRETLTDATGSYLKVQRLLGVQLPITMLLSLSGTKGYGLFIGEDFHEYAVDRDALLLPPVKVESFDGNPTIAMKPLFDRLWNAAGVARCFEYDE